MSVLESNKEPHIKTRNQKDDEFDLDNEQIVCLRNARGKEDERPVFNVFY